jgi:NAD(P)H-hydrate repair Nnr-like enzyme with NAD(P)H-hydrate dehydratase domain
MQAMTITLGERIMLLSLDDESGLPREAMRAEYAMAGAALMELALAGRLGLGGDTIEVLDRTPVRVTAVDPVLALIADDKKSLKADHWLYVLRSPAEKAARQGLLEKDLVREERKKVLRLFTTRRYPEADGGPERELRRRLTAVVVEGAEPDERLIALLALLHGSGLHKLALPETAAVTKRLEELTADHWAGTTVRRVMESVHAAMLAITVSLTAVTMVTTMS